MGKLTISMAMFNSFLYVYQRVRGVKNMMGKGLFKYPTKMGYLYPTTWSLLGYTSGIDRDPLAGTPYSVREDCGNGGPISHGVPINSMDLGVAIAMGLQPAYPLVNKQKAIENGH